MKNIQGLQCIPFTCSTVSVQDTCLNQLQMQSSTKALELKDAQKKKMAATNLTTGQHNLEPSGTNRKMTTRFSRYGQICYFHIRHTSETAT